MEFLNLFAVFCVQLQVNRLVRLNEGDVIQRQFVTIQFRVHLDCINNTLSDIEFIPAKEPGKVPLASAYFEAMQNGCSISVNLSNIIILQAF